MKKLLVIGSLIVSANLWAGGVVGGGGMGVVCKNANGEESVRLLDIYEAQVAGKKFIELTGELLEDLHTIGKRIYPRNPEKIGSFAVEALMNSFWFKNIPEDTVLNPTDDALPALLPKECSIKQIASYQNQELIYVDQTLHEKLDYLNQLALVAHEYIYKNERDGDVKDSRYTRLIIGMALEKDLGIIPFDWSNTYLEKVDLAIKRCESIGVEQETEFYVLPKGYEVSESLNLIVFKKLNGHTMLNLNAALVAFPEGGEIKTETTRLLAAGMGQTNMTLRSMAQGLFISWSGYFPGDKFKNVEFACEDL